VNQLSYLGGKHVKSMIKRLMGKVFKNEMLKDFSYTGKKSFQLYQFVQLYLLRLCINLNC